MKPIYRLIQSMSMSEKRYFKTYSKTHIIGKQNKYYILFDLLTKQELYDEKKLIDNLKAYHYEIKYLSADFNYLYRAVLKSLNSFNRTKTLNLIIKENLTSIEILFFKGLYKDALSLIKKTKKKLNVIQNDVLMLDLLKWEKKCIGYTKGLDEAKRVNENLNIYIERISTTKQLTALYYKTYEYKLNVGKLSKSKLKSKLNKLITHKALKNFDSLVSIDAKMFFLLSYVHYYELVDDSKNELIYIEKLIDILDSNQNFFFNYPMDYIAIYNKYLDILKFKSEALFFNAICTIKEFPKKVTLQKASIKERVTFHTKYFTIQHYLYHKKDKQVLKEVLKFELFLKQKKFGLENFYLVRAYYLIAQFYFINANFSKALKTINTILNEFNFNVSLFFSERAKVLNFMIHYELDNISYAKNLYKKLIKKIRFVSVEKDIINNINNCLIDQNSKFDLNLKNHTNKINSNNDRDLVIINKLYSDYLAEKLETSKPNLND